MKVLIRKKLFKASDLPALWAAISKITADVAADLKVLVPSNKFRCKTSLLTAVGTKRKYYT